MQYSNLGFSTITAMHILHGIRVVFLDQRLIQQLLRIVKLQHRWQGAQLGNTVVSNDRPILAVMVEREEKGRKGGTK